MSALTGNNVKDTYQGLLKLANSTTGITSVAQSIQDGLGNNTPLQMSNTEVIVNGDFLLNVVPSGSSSNQVLVLNTTTNQVERRTDAGTSGSSGTS